MAFIQEVMPWHEGEEAMHRLLKVPAQENPTSPFLTPGAGFMLAKSPLLAIGALDKDNRPWTSVWGGEAGFAGPLGNSVIGIKCAVNRKHDPVVESLLGSESAEGDMVQPSETHVVGGLAIDLATRRRVKLHGRMVAGMLGKSGEQPMSSTSSTEVADAQLAVQVDQSLGNCPKYLNRKDIKPVTPEPRLASSSLPLPQKALDLVDKADLFFISSSNHGADMDTNHRGGPPGFVRTLANSKEEGTVFVFPEYSGNRLYQTLGNLQTTPMAGMTFPDFDTGNVLYITGKTEILVGEKASGLLPRSNLAVKITVSAARLVEKGLSFRGIAGERSPYNPTVRYLRSEKAAIDVSGRSETELRAKLVEKETITPTISRFKFSLDEPRTWKAGQYVALGFDEELSQGYSHMRDDDPRSLNDDFVRTFTISSSPDPKKPTEFEITIRKVGEVTDWLFRQTSRSHLDLPVRGIGGEFFIEPPSAQCEVVPVIAGGIGITPFMAQLSSFPVEDLSRLTLFWTVRAVDVSLVSAVLDRYPDLGMRTRLYITQSQNTDSANKEILDRLAQRVMGLFERRLSKNDLLDPTHGAAQASKWYLCAGVELRKSVMLWLHSDDAMHPKEVIYEDFNY